MWGVGGGVGGGGGGGDEAKVGAGDALVGLPDPLLCGCPPSPGPITRQTSAGFRARGRSKT